MPKVKKINKKNKLKIETKTIFFQSFDKKKVNLIWKGSNIEEKDSLKEPLVLNFDNQDFYFYEEGISKSEGYFSKRWVKFKSNLDLNQKEKVLENYDRLVDKKNLYKRFIILEFIHKFYQVDILAVISGFFNFTLSDLQQKNKNLETKVNFLNIRFNDLHSIFYFFKFKINLLEKSIEDLYEKNQNEELDNQIFQNLNENLEKEITNYRQGFDCLNQDFISFLKEIKDLESHFIFNNKGSIKISKVGILNFLVDNDRLASDLADKLASILEKNIKMFKPIYVNFNEGSKIIDNIFDQQFDSEFNINNFGPSTSGVSKNVQNIRDLDSGLVFQSNPIVEEINLAVVPSQIADYDINNFGASTSGVSKNVQNIRDLDSGLVFQSNPIVEEINLPVVPSQIADYDINNFGASTSGVSKNVQNIRDLDSGLVFQSNPIVEEINLAVVPSQIIDYDINNFGPSTSGVSKNVQNIRDLDSGLVQTDQVEQQFNSEAIIKQLIDYDINNYGVLTSSILEDAQNIKKREFKPRLQKRLVLQPILLKSNYLNNKHLIWFGVDKIVDINEEPLILKFNKIDYYFYSKGIQQSVSIPSGTINYNIKLDYHRQNQIFEAFSEKMNKEDIFQQNLLLKLKIEFLRNKLQYLIDFSTKEDLFSNNNNLKSKLNRINLETDYLSLKSFRLSKNIRFSNGMVNFKDLSINNFQISNNENKEELILLFESCNNLCQNLEDVSSMIQNQFVDKPRKMIENIDEEPLKKKRKNEAQNLILSNQVNTEENSSFFSPMILNPNFNENHSDWLEDFDENMFDL